MRKPKKMKNVKSNWSGTCSECGGWKLKSYRHPDRPTDFGRLVCASCCQKVLDRKYGPRVAAGAP